MCVFTGAAGSETEGGAFDGPKISHDTQVTQVFTVICSTLR